MSEYEEQASLPANPEAEKALIACVLMDQGDAADAVMAMAGERGVTSKHFYDGRYKVLWEIVDGLRKAEPALPADFTNVATKLMEREMWESVGAPLLNTLSTYLPSAANARTYLDGVVKSWQRRSLILACRTAIEAGMQGEDVSETTVGLLEGLQAELADIGAVASAASAFTGLGQLLKDAIISLQARFKMRGRFSGINTGIADIDRMTDGLQPGQLILIPGRPSMGKTALGFQIGLHAALKNSYFYSDDKEKMKEVFRKERVPVGCFSVEMGDVLLGQRFLAQLTGVSVKSFATGFMSRKTLDDAQEKMIDVLSDLEGVVFEVDDTPGLSIQQLEARARFLVVQKGVKLLVVDYAQLLTSNSKRAERSEREELDEVSRGLKRIARVLNVPVIVCVQLNRDVDDRPGHVPMLSDMKGCGQLEQDADIVMCPVRPCYYAKSDDQRVKALDKYNLSELPMDQPGPANDYLAANWMKVSGMTELEKQFFLLEGYAEIHVIKQRGGAVGMVKCWFYPEQCWFHGWTRKPFSNNQAERQENLGENHGEEAA